MKDSQLIAVLKTVSDKEGRELRKWLNSPFHNHRQDVIDLFEYLMKNEHLNKGTALKKEKVFTKIFKKEAFDDAKIRQTMHFLLKCIEEYLSYKELTKDKTRKAILLARNYRNRNLDKVFEKEFNKINKLQKNPVYRNADFYHNEFLIQQELNLYESSKKRSHNHLQEVSDALDKNYIGEKLKLYCLHFSNKRVNKKEFKEGLIHEILNHIEAENLLDIPAISIYYYVYKSLSNTTNDNPYFNELKTAIHRYGHLFPKGEIRDILLMAINYCIVRHNRGQDTFGRESLDLYKYGLKQELLVENNQISRYSFVNIIRFAGMYREFEWGHHFIEKYQSFLAEKNRENIVHFCRARVFFEEERYDEAMEDLAKVKEDDLLLNLSSKHTLLKIFFKKDEYEVLDSLLDSMTKYLQRKGVTENYRNVYSSIIKLMKRLIKVNPYSSDDLKQLEERIHKAPYLPHAERAWFLAQLKDIKL